MVLLPILANILPTLIAMYATRAWFRELSVVARLALAWLVSQVVVTTASYLLGCALVSIVSPTLLFANIALLVIEVCIGARILTRHRDTARECWRHAVECVRGSRSSLLFAFLSLILSVILFRVHLFERDGVLHRSHIYWDITAHYPIIQSFVLGDNFPARDETAAELPLVYHFFGDLQVANNVSLGASLSGALLWISALSLTSLMILVREYALRLFRGEAAGWIAGLLVVTSSNLRWFFDIFESAPAQSFFRPFFERGGPMRFSNPEFSFGRFNVSMFNIFYFIEERHVLFSSALVVMAALFIREVTTVSRRAALVVGFILAMCSQWNFFVFPMLVVVVASVCLLREPRAHRGLTLVALLGLGALLTLATRSVLVSSGWFELHGASPELNVRFAAESESASFSFSRFVAYYGFAMGPTLLGAFMGLIVAWRKSRRDFWILAPVIVVTFVLINSVNVMANNIYENHKWAKPLQGFLNILAVAPCALLLQRRSPLRMGITACAALLLTISGVMEAIAFTRSFSMPIAPYPSVMIKLIWERTRPHEVFVTALPREVLLAGRRVYFLHHKTLDGTPPHIQGLGFKFALRAGQEARLYGATSPETFCSVARELKVDVIEFSPDQQKLPLYVAIKEHEIFKAVPYKETEPRSYISSRFCSAPPTVASRLSNP
jgi:hypothetical protein